MKFNIWFYLVVGLLVFFWLKVAQHAALMFWGERTDARVILVTQVPGPRSVYRGFYEFITLDKTIATGECPCSKHAEGRTLEVKYLRTFPSINGPADRASGILYICLWAGAAWILSGLTLKPGVSGGTNAQGRFVDQNAKYYLRYSMGAGFMLTALFLVLLSPLTLPLWTSLRSLTAENVPSVAEGSDDLEIKRGAPLGNAENGNLFTISGDRIFFHFWKYWEGALFLPAGLYQCFTSSDKAMPEPVGEFPENMMIYKGVESYDGWIYFKLMKGIARVRIDGKKYQRLVKDNISGFTIVNDTLFFQMQWDSDRIYRIHLNGGGQKRLCREKTGSFSVAGDGWIYYTNETDGGRLYRMREDGSHRESILDIVPGQIVAEPQFCWFLGSQDKHLFRWIAATGEVESILQEPIDAFAFTGSDLVILKDGKFSVFDMETRRERMIADALGEYDEFSVYGGRIYQRAESVGHGAVVSIGLDETDWTYHTAVLTESE